MGPSRRNPPAPRLNSRDVHDWTLKTGAIFLRDIECITIPIPSAVNSPEWMVIAEVHPVDLRPVGRNGEWGDCNIFISYRKYRARA